MIFWGMGAWIYNGVFSEDIWKLLTSDVREIREEFSRYSLEKSLELLDLVLENRSKVVAIIGDKWNSLSLIQDEIIVRITELIEIDNSVNNQVDIFKLVEWIKNNKGRKQAIIFLFNNNKNLAIEYGKYVKKYYRENIEIKNEWEVITFDKPSDKDSFCFYREDWEQIFSISIWLIKIEDIEKAYKTLNP